MLCASAQDTKQSVANESGAKESGPNEIATNGLARLREQVALLSDPSYRVRELAQWRLTQDPSKSIVVLRSAIQSADHQSGPQMVDLLTEFALDSNVTTSLLAMDILRETAEQVTVVGRLAKNSLFAISDLQEQQAMEIMLHHEAEIGERRFSLNGTKGQNYDQALHIDDRFTGDEETLKWIPLLKSIDTVCLEGPKITRKHLEAVTKMPEIRNLKLKSLNLAPADYELLREFQSLEHLGLLYVDISDEQISLLKELPVSNTMKISGTKVTEEGFEKLRTYLDDVTFYFGAGGFLGVGPPLTNPTSTYIGRIIENSAAAAAGLRVGDEILEIDAVPVASFTELRLQLGEYEANTKIKIKVRRGEKVTDFEVELKEET